MRDRVLLGMPYDRPSRLPVPGRPATPLRRPVPARWTTVDRRGRRVVLTGVVTHEDGDRVAFEHAHPVRGVWHVWVARAAVVRDAP
ncbi:hypothetical protein H1Q78_03885 [Cellulosimicrobium cellulans]|uniref:hypothetical protein n=1 Tax=Cellulosimicrobium cellulans TaxID=1710 RepID=UPI001EDB3F47|nr:hypothetical protein [Cellulosimicrobium cellulans]UKJ64574.1 hypothetical protein H1Q78_03885 [Cellulosimicrobium cellulans]